MFSLRLTTTYYTHYSPLTAHHPLLITCRFPGAATPLRTCLPLATPPQAWLPALRALGRLACAYTSWLHAQRDRWSVACRPMSNTVLPSLRPAGARGPLSAPGRAPGCPELRPASADQPAGPHICWSIISGLCSTQVPPPRPRGTLRVRATAAGARGAAAGAAAARRRRRGRGGPLGAAAAAARARAEWRRASRDADRGGGCAATAARATRGVAPRDAQPQRLHRLGARLGAVRR